MPMFQTTASHPNPTVMTMLTTLPYTVSSAFGVNIHTHSPNARPWIVIIQPMEQLAMGNVEFNVPTSIASAGAWDMVRIILPSHKLAQPDGLHLSHEKYHLLVDIGSI
jgi:hypothetical protein